MVSTDVEGQVFGKNWQHTRTFSNTIVGSSAIYNGNRWFVRNQFATATWEFVERPLGDKYGYYGIYFDADNVLWFGMDETGGFRFAFSEGYFLTGPNWDDVPGDIHVYDPNGAHFIFFGPTADEHLRGKLKQFIEPTMRYQSFSYDPQGRLTEMSETLGMGPTAHTGRFTYLWGDFINQVTLSIDDQDVSRANYTYHSGQTSQGNVGDLQHVVNQEYRAGSWETTGEDYYTYYKPGDADGAPSLVKMTFGPEALYQLRTNEHVEPQDASEAQLAEWAEYIYAYDESSRVRSEYVHDGDFLFQFEYYRRGNQPPLPSSSSRSSSSLSSTSSTSSFSSFSSASSGSSGGIVFPPPGFPEDYNVWQGLTIETLPDGNKIYAYFNSAGQVILKVFYAGVKKWCRGYRFDDSSRTILIAEPTAIAGYDEHSDGLFELRSDAGFIKHIQVTHLDPPSPSGITAIREELISEGADGEKILIRRRGYSKQTVGDYGIRVPASDTLYQSSEGDLSPATTDRSVSFFPNSYTPSSVVIAQPVVPAEQHGSGVAEARNEVYSENNQLVWSRDEKGVINGFSYDPETGAIVRLIRDVDTELVPNVPDGWTTPAGGGKNLITDYGHDALGRITEELGPEHVINIDGVPTLIRRASWTVYQDEAREIWSGMGYFDVGETIPSYVLVNPVQITRYTHDWQRITDEIVAVRESTAGPLVDSSFPQETWVRWKHLSYFKGGWLASERLYFAIPESGDGQEGLNYNQTDYSYDVMKRLVRVREPGGSIRRFMRNARGWEYEVWCGTDDTGATPENPAGEGSPNNMVKVAERVYDDDQDGGNGLVTSLKLFTSESEWRSTSYAYDFRGRRVTTDGEQSATELFSYDNVGRLLSTERRNRDLSYRLISLETTRFDNRGRPYEATRIAVDPNTGEQGNSLKSLTWYDPTGNVIQVRALDSQRLEKRLYDSLGRVVFECVACTNATLTYAQAVSLNGDLILQQVENVIDDGDNVVWQRTRERNHDAEGTGALKEPTGVQPCARVSYTGMYQDARGRVVAVANWGTNGGIEPVRPPEIPTPSETLLLSRSSYDPRGDLVLTTDPNGVSTRLVFDDLGRLVMTVENYDPESMPL